MAFQRGVMGGEEGQWQVEERLDVTVDCGCPQLTIDREALIILIDTMSTALLRSLTDGRPRNPLEIPMNLGLTDHEDRLLNTAHYIRVAEFIKDFNERAGIE